MIESIVEPQNAACANLLDAPTTAIKWVKCRGCEGEIGVPLSLIGDRVDCPGCGLSVHPGPNILFRRAARAKTGKDPQSANQLDMASVDRSEKADKKPESKRFVKIAFAAFALGAILVFVPMKIINQRPETWNGVLMEGKGWPVGWGRFCSSILPRKELTVPAPPGLFRWERWTIERPDDKDMAVYTRTDEKGKWKAYYSLDQLANSGLFNRHYVVRDDRLERASWPETFGHDSFFTTKGDAE